MILDHTKIIVPDPVLENDVSIVHALTRALLTYSIVFGRPHPTDGSRFFSVSRSATEIQIPRTCSLFPRHIQIHSNEIVAAGAELGS